MFPAHAGMSRVTRQVTEYDSNVPRTRGDEPTKTRMIYTGGQCSPHTRG